MKWYLVLFLLQVKRAPKCLIMIRIGLIFYFLIILIGSEFRINVYMIAKDFKNQNNPFLFDIPKFCGKNVNDKNFYLETLELYLL